ncbi:MAG TPA: polymer-forming cytoskeletal protein [Pyrinomonadaceae bacterium]|nr:polymer-forming cytoskeletal protein [Pyrinomonadaceae bacterium]
MLRMGKNPNEDKGQPEADYANRNYTPYQNNDAYRPAPDGAATPKALTESETIAREIKDGSLSGFVGSGTVITGEASFKSMLRVDGRFSGRIHSTGGTLIVGSGGQVDANIEVAVATIHGIVTGDIVATDRIELGRAAKLTGNIQAPSLMIEQGAVFEGSCQMTQAKAAAEKPKVERKDNVLDASRLDASKLDAVKTEPKKPEDNNKPAVAAVAT